MLASTRRPARETTGRVDASRRRASSRRRARGSGARSEKKKPPAARGATRLETRRETGASRDTDARARYAPAARCLGGRAVRVCALAAGSLASRPPFPRRVMKHESHETPDGVKAAHENIQRPCRNLERLFLGFKPWAAAANENAHTACSDRTTIPRQDGHPCRTPRHYRIPEYT